MNGGDRTLVDKYMSPDYRMTAPGIELAGQDAMKGFIGGEGNDQEQRGPAPRGSD